MFLNYKFELNEFEYFSRNELNSSCNESSNEQLSSQELFHYQIFINSLKQQLVDSCQNHDFSTLEKIFEQIDSNFKPEPSIGEIFEFIELPICILNLLQYEEWLKNTSIWKVLCHITFLCSKETNGFLIENHIIEIIKNTIHSNNPDNIISSCICLGNLIASTGNTYQDLILAIITFEDTTCYFTADILPSLATLFLLSNIIHFFNIIPNDEFPQNLLEALFKNDNWNSAFFFSFSFFLFRTIICFIEMMKVKPDISIIFYQDISPFIGIDTADGPISIFHLFYNFLRKTDVSEIKNAILLFFARNLQIQKTYLKNNPTQQEIFYGNINFMFDSIFNKEKDIQYEEQIDLNTKLTLLTNSIRIKARYGVYLEQKVLMGILKKVFTLNSQDSFKVKNGVLLLILAIIENYHNNLDLMRFGDMSMVSILIQGLGFGNKVRILDAILILINAFAYSPESEKIKNTFIKEDIESELNQLMTDEPDISSKAQLVRHILCLTPNE